MKAYFGLKNPPVKIAKVAIGDGAMTTEQAFELLPAVGTGSSTFSYLIQFSAQRYRNISATYWL